MFIQISTKQKNKTYFTRIILKIHEETEITKSISIDSCLQNVTIFANSVLIKYILYNRIMFIFLKIFQSIA